MYTLYFYPGACSLATQVVLRELDQKVTLIDKAGVDHFSNINPVGSVPALLDGEGERILTEGAAIMLYLLNKHPNALLAKTGEAKQLGIQHIMFANATMHPAYSKLFFIGQNMTDSEVKTQALNAAAEGISHLWQVVETQLANKAFFGGDKPSAADIMLTVYARWGSYFPVDIAIGKRTREMLNTIENLPSFQAAIEAERAASEAVA